MRLTEEEYLNLVGDRPVPSPKKNKYGSRSVTVDGIKFPSQREANRYCELKLLQRDGQVIYFLMQVPFLLDGGVKYLLDFMIFWTSGKVTHEDTKGCKTQVYILKKKQVEARYPIKIKEV